MFSWLRCAREWQAGNKQAAGSDCITAVSGISGWQNNGLHKRIFEKEGIKNWDGGTKW